MPASQSRLPEPASPLATSAPAANTAAAVTLPGANLACWVVETIDFSYAGSGTLSGGGVVLKDGSTAVWQLDVDAKGVYAKTFSPPLRLSPGAGLTATLAAGSANVTGKLNVGCRREAVTGRFRNAFDFALPGNSQYAATL